MEINSSSSFDFSKMNSYYVYAFLDPRKPKYYCYESICFLFEPFYIGKGRGRRLQNTTRACRGTYVSNKIEKIKRLKLEPIVLKINDSLNEQDAFKLEMQLIKEIGRVTTGSGPLLNFTDGGEGASGYTWSEDAKKRMSETRKGRKTGYTHSAEMRKWMSETRKGRYATEETKKKISGENHHGFGKIRSQEVRRKISESRKGARTPEEVRQRISSSKKGVHLSEEVKQKRAATSHYRSKLQLGEVWLIKRIVGSDYYKTGRLSDLKIAKMFRVHSTTVRNIKLTKTWKYAAEER